MLGDIVELRCVTPIACIYAHSHVDAIARLTDEQGTFIARQLDRVAVRIVRISRNTIENGGLERPRSSGFQRPIDEVTQRNAALVEEATAASKSMDDQAQHLLQTIGFFSIEGHEGVGYRRQQVR